METKVKFNKIQDKSLVRAVIDEIILKIREGFLKPGDKLPPERDLISQFNVSRSIIRESLRALDILNLIEIKPGIGTFIKALKFNEIINPGKIIFILNKEDLLELLEVRKILEMEAIKLSVSKVTEEDISYLEARIKKMDNFLKEQNIDEYILEDSSFHKKIIECSGNKILVSIFNSILPLIYESISTTTKINNAWESGLRTHKKILRSIKERNKEEASSSILEHIEDINNTVKKFFNKS